MASVARLIRREPRVAVAILIAMAGAGTVFSVAFLEMLGVVRIFAVTHVHGDTVSASRAFGIASPSMMLSNAWKWGTALFAVGLAVWVLRVARRTAGYRIGALRTIGLFTPPFGAAVLAGALHAATDVIVDDTDRDRWHALITLTCAWGIAAMIVSWMVTPGWSSIEPVATGARWVSMAVGALVVVSLLLALATATAVTCAWRRMSPAAAKDLERRLAELPRR